MNYDENIIIILTASPYTSCILQQPQGVYKVRLPYYKYPPQQQLSSSMAYVSWAVPQQFVLSELSPNEMELNGTSDLSVSA